MRDKPVFAIFVVAYNAVDTLAKLLDRIPAETWNEVGEVFVFDDCSKDETAILAHGYKSVNGVEKLKVFRNDSNLGYGGNQKIGYRYALEKGFDYVILLHGDAQYAPEKIPDFMREAVRSRPAAVLGSRMMEKSSALRGGMPFYKFLGNIILTKVQNALLHSSLSEFHSGYRMYSTEVLKKLHLERYSDDFHFDTQILVEMIHRGEKVVEIPIPTYYGGEICYVNGFKYAANVLRSVGQYKLFTLGFSSCDWVAPHSQTRYAPKASPFSSHRRVVRLVPADSEVLDLGAEGHYADELRGRGCKVWGVTLSELPREMEEKYEKLIVSDIETGVWKKEIAGRTFDVVVMADIIEHLRTSKNLVSGIKDLLKKDGVVVASTPNIANFYVRACLFCGYFPYGKRGILDETHVHFYTIRSFRKLFESEGFRVEEEMCTPIPFELFAGESAFSRFFFGALERLYYILVKIWPSLFAYQTVLRLREKPRQ